MHHKTIIILAIVLLPQQTYSMKRPGQAITPDTLTKKTCSDQSTHNQLLVDIQKNIFGFNPDAIGKIISTEQAAQLNPQEKVELHKTAKELKGTIIQMREAGKEIIERTDNPAIKEKFSYDDEYQKIKKTTRYLYALKFLPNLTFPQTIFTPAPLCDYQLQSKDTRVKPDQVLVVLIKNEQKKISLCCYHIGLDSVVEALAHQKNKGVAIEVITNQTQGDKTPNSPATVFLMKNGITVLAPKKQYEQMHEKFVIFDDNLLNKSLVWNGSYNPTSHSNTHSWDSVNIMDHPQTIKQYQQRFEEIKIKSSNQTITAIVPCQPSKSVYARS